GARPPGRVESTRGLWRDCFRPSCTSRRRTSRCWMAPTNASKSMSWVGGSAVVEVWQIGTGSDDVVVVTVSAPGHRCWPAAGADENALFSEFQYHVETGEKSLPWLAIFWHLLLLSLSSYRSWGRHQVSKRACGCSCVMK